MNFKTWIDQKTPKTLGVVLHQELGTIRVWRHRNIIPRNVWPEIMVKFPEVGLSDLMEWEEAARQ